VGAKRALGCGILRVAPWLMKFLSMAGTAAMFLVGGGILTHNVRALHFAIEAIDGVLGTILGMLADLLVGVLVGTVVFDAEVFAPEMVIWPSARRCLLMADAVEKGFWPGGQTNIDSR